MTLLDECAARMEKCPTVHGKPSLGVFLCISDLKKRMVHIFTVHDLQKIILYHSATTHRASRIRCSLRSLHQFCRQMSTCNEHKRQERRAVAEHLAAAARGLRVRGVLANQSIIARSTLSSTPGGAPLTPLILVGSWASESSPKANMPCVGPDIYGEMDIVCVVCGERQRTTQPDIDTGTRHSSGEQHRMVDVDCALWCCIRAEARR